ncbi:hypothetical protein M011DRAFT_478251 [Sporormia fimetaria CBS 119925]|uniref:BTB domain-containing protein n=1 Tax=Sporormia fimetaria CBS 119925 TaxID=1340428 RepID=A0A6A6VAT7_9PLEO|nr:hypothetical protein M011DRAFT_478251 [Sporormia fimetaria CBS 119925]
MGSTKQDTAWDTMSDAAMTAAKLRKRAFNDPALSDLTIRTTDEEGEPIESHVHKLYLCELFGVFRSMFAPGMERAEDSVLEVGENGERIWRDFLDNIKVWELARRYECRDLEGLALKVCQGVYAALELAINEDSQATIIRDHIVDHIELYYDTCKAPAGTQIGLTLAEIVRYAQDSKIWGVNLNLYGEGDVESLVKTLPAFAQDLGWVYFQKHREEYCVRRTLSHLVR